MFTVSVSSAKTFQDCNMKWYLDKVVGVPREDTPALQIGALFGKLLEAVTNRCNLEPFLEKSEVVDSLYEKNKVWIHKIPNEKEIHAEFELKHKLAEHLEFVGFIDAIYEEGEGDKKNVIIRDYKTVGDWRWALTDIQLSADEQVNIYAYFIDKMLFGLVPIWLEHIQFNKKTGMRKMVRVPYDREQGKRVFDWIVLSGEEMDELKTLPIERALKNLDSCGKYGGCPNREFCKGTIGLEELMNPYVKERSKAELSSMKPEERLMELKKEQEFNTLLKKGSNMGNLQDRLKLLREKTEEKAKEGVEVFVAPKNLEVEIKEEGKPTETVEVVVEVEKKTRTRRTKAEMEATPTSKVEVLEPREVLPQNDRKMTAKQCLVLVGCSFLEEDKNNPSDFLHEKYIAPVLAQERIPHISCSEFSKANKQVMLFGESILNEIYEKYEHINIDFRRPVDALVYSMILDIDVRKNGNRFRLIRSTF